jgi:TRAP-type C4-dicarboxylate transport system permease small subunit
MMPFDKARTITALIIFLLVVLAALYLGYRGWHIARRETFRKASEFDSVARGFVDTAALGDEGCMVLRHLWHSI